MTDMADIDQVDTNPADGPTDAADTRVRVQGKKTMRAAQTAKKPAAKHSKHAAKRTESSTHAGNDRSTIVTIGLVVVALLILFNQYQLSSIAGSLHLAPKSSSFLAKFKSMSLSGEGKIVGPQLNPDGKTTKLVEWPTISGMPKPEHTGDAAKDAIDYVIPKGVPSYAESGPGSELLQGLSFDDPIAAQKIWAQLEGNGRVGTSKRIQLTADEEQRYKKLTNIFTCDYCCGGPNSVTRIAQCGCQHAYAWKGMARFFTKYYPEKTDEEIMGEMTKAKAMWYQKGMVEDYLVYTGQKDANTLRHGGSAGIKQQFAGQNSGTSASASDVNTDSLNTMVGGC